MRVFTAILATESNSFSTIPTGSAAFAASLKRGAEVFEDTGWFGSFARRLRELAEPENAEIIPSLFAFAQPAAPTVQSVYEDMRDTILYDLQAAGRVDMVVLMLHGAMMAQQTWDCEGDILARVREIVGPDVPIGVVADPHAHLTEAMVANATVVSFQKEYPHTDMLERLDDVWDMCRRVMRGEIAPVAAIHDCRMISLWPTDPEPMRGFVDRTMAMEGRDGVLSVSFVHGFGWGDTPVTGAKMLVYTDNDPAKAAKVAAELRAEIWSLRDQTMMDLVPLDQAVRRMAEVEHGPLVLADMADNAGGGAPGDSTFVLRAVLDAGVRDVGFALFCDPQAALACHDAGLGATVALRIGGKTGPASGDPIDLDVVVMGLDENGWESETGAGDWPLGRTAWVRAHGVDVILCSERNQCFHPTAFSHLGLDPSTLKALVIKSTNHFRAGFDPIASETLYIDAPGAIAPNFASMPFKVFDKPYWPKVADPHGLETPRD
jgi:microcystin degradation protein MlrC